MLSKLRRIVTYFMILLVMKYLNLIAKIKASFHFDKVLYTTPYAGQKILLIALYEKGVLRNDIQRLLALAKKKHLYVIGVNTRRLQEDTDLSKHFDCYIEKYNFGRDFGSYKTGFRYIFKHKLDQTCPRLLMLNDSVFYESTRCEAFIDTLICSDVQVLGATENFEFEHHIGSFCISFDCSIIRNPKFKKFWHHYKNTNIRPCVIKSGEMGLTKLLKNIMSTNESMQILYDIILISKKLDADITVLNKSLQITCRPILPTLGKRVTIQKVLSDFVRRHYALGAPLGSTIPIIQGHTLSNSVFHECSFYVLVDLLKNKLNINDEHLESKLSTFIKSLIIEQSSMCSQIHKNAELFLSLGLPLIKLDLNFRGFLSTNDIICLSSYLQPNEALELKVLLLKNVYYRKVLRRWGKALADFGFL